MVRAIMELDDFRAVAAAPAVGLDEQVRPGKLGSTVLRVLDPAVGDREHDRHRPYAGPGAGAEKAQLVAEPVLFVAVGAQQLIEGALGLHAPQIFVSARPQLRAEQLEHIVLARPQARRQPDAEMIRELRQIRPAAGGFGARAVERQVAAERGRNDRQRPSERRDRHHRQTPPWHALQERTPVAGAQEPDGLVPVALGRKPMERRRPQPRRNYRRRPVKDFGHVSSP